jgi:hypothetical protein
LDSNKRDKVYDPVRKLKPTRRSVSGVYVFRGSRALEFESTLERDFLMRMEFFQSVQDIVPQPVRIPFLGSNGREYTYTPDFLVYYKLRGDDYPDYPIPTLVEVKPSEQWRIHRHEWMPKWRTAHRYARQQGWDFRIYDESRIRDLTLDNIRFLERYKRMRFPEEESRWILENLGMHSSVPFHLALSTHFMGDFMAEGVAHLWHLVAVRRLDCDISRPLNNLTELWVVTEND